MTVSGGISECAGDTPAALIERARMLLRQAKETGRNRLCHDVDMF